MGVARILRLRRELHAPPLRMLAAELECCGMPHWVYILKCSDCSYYTGSTSNLDYRIAQHQSGVIEGYTQSRRPVELAWSAEFATEHDAFVIERKLKGWSRAKKEALIRGDWAGIHEIVKKERQRREGTKRKQAS